MFQGGERGSSGERRDNGKSGKDGSRRRSPTSSRADNDNGDQPSNWQGIIDKLRGCPASSMSVDNMTNVIGLIADLIRSKSQTKGTRTKEEEGQLRQLQASGWNAAPNKRVFYLHPMPMGRNANFKGTGALLINPQTTDAEHSFPNIFT
jgi:hypothetical protein